MNPPRIDGSLTGDEQRMVTRVMLPFPGIDRSLIEGLVGLGYREPDLQNMLTALELNASTARLRRNDPQRVQLMNGALIALIERFKAALYTEQYDILVGVGYTPNEIGNSLFTNLLSPAKLLIRTTYASRECERFYQLGYTDVDVRSLIRAGVTVSQMRTLANRIYDARGRGVDAQGLTIQQIHDMLFKDRPINGKRTLGIVPALLSGIHAKMREGEVARCIMEYVTMFDIPYGPGGADGQVDVGTQHIIVEVKVDSVSDGGDTLKQVRGEMISDIMNPPDVNGVRKSIILYAPGYGTSATSSIQEIGGHVVKSCGQLREQIRQRGGP